MNVITLDQILNQNPAVTLLKRALSTDRLSHAYLFTGPKGVGKETTAYAFVFHLFCQKDPLSPCGVCVACKKISKETHPDVLKISPEKKEIKIDQIREIINFLRYRPIEAKYKVTLIQNAERMNLEAANALLKSLEEPPSYGIFILITENFTQLLPTVVSRSQVVRFHPLPKTTVYRVLTERYGFEKQVSQTLAEISQGSLGRALTIAEKGFLEELNSFVKAGFSNSPYLRFRVAERFASFNYQDLEVIFYLVLVWIWRSYLKRLIDYPYPEAFPEEIYPKEPYPAFSLIQETLQALDRYLNPELVFYRLFLRMFG
ncbi:DNA polymerase III subunit delta' [Thermodesulfobacterium sp.]|jgi:DNA polymerase-3 subunit delta'|uniref:DNA polymerase III subunit delta' n=1 Tax=Thermodesulfobacterium sp. TaxID=1965289 RepID=UPI002647A480|nr:DNA polymerase III subunit delta' [Thermodesulfobacterium sp.]MDN5379609.1 polymerase subunit delta [Thermodesulfobacterium sp.]